MIASSRTARTASGRISGSGFAIAKISGFGAIDFAISGVTESLAERPRKMSAPCIASARVRLSVFAA